MFSLHRPMAAVIDELVAAACRLPVSCPRLLTLEDGLGNRRLPFAFAHDRSRSCIGDGEAVFAAARLAFQRWANFDLGWVRVANPSAAIAAGQIVAVEVHALGLWSLNFSRIEETVSTATNFGFLYATTGMHVEQGEERFLLELDNETGEVWYEIEASSRPRHALARLGFPITRALQHRFVTESHTRLQKEVHSSTRRSG